MGAGGWNNNNNKDQFQNLVEITTNVEASITWKTNIYRAGGWNNNNNKD